MVELTRVEQLPDGVLLDLQTDLLPAPRPRLSPRGVYLPKQYRKYRDTLAELLAQHIPTDARVYRVYITVYRDIPVCDKRYGDVDNLVKTVLDALPVDDAGVSQISAIKRVGAPRLVITAHWRSSGE